MELIQLRYFVTIAETMSFTGAAEILHISQPALSYQMRNLEEGTGHQAVRPQRPAIHLTADGHLFLPLAQAVLHRADEAVRILPEHLGVEEGEVRVGCNPSVAAYLVPACWPTSTEDYPESEWRSIEGGDTRPPTPRPERHRGFRRGHRLRFAADARGHAAWQRVLRSSPRCATASPAVSPSIYTSCRRRNSCSPTAPTISPAVLTTRVGRAGFEPRVMYETSSIEAVKNFVRQGLGISILPAIALEGSGGRPSPSSPSRAASPAISTSSWRESGRSHGLPRRSSPS